MAMQMPMPTDITLQHIYQGNRAVAVEYYAQGAEGGKAAWVRMDAPAISHQSSGDASVQEEAARQRRSREQPPQLVRAGSIAV